MKIPNISKLKGAFGVGKAVLAAHRPEILLATSVVGGIASTILGARGGYEARDKIASEEMERVMMKLTPEACVEVEELVNDDANRLTVKEKADLTWKCYVPAGLTLVGSVASTTGLHLVHVKEKKALVTAGAIALEEAREKFKRWENETLGALDDGDVEKIQERVFEGSMDKDGKVKFQNSDGEIEELYLVRDAFTGRDIFSNEQRIADGLNSLNRWLVKEGDVELNHFYGVAGFGNVELGDEVGWSGEPVSISWDLVQRDDGRPVRRFTFRPSPTRSYGRPD